MFDAATQRPHLTAEDAQRIAREQFIRQPHTARQLPSDRDQNFYLEEPSGEAFVLKIAAAAEDEAVLDFQNQALLHLAACHPAPAAFPQPVAAHSAPPATRHSLLVTITGNGRPHLVRLLTYLPGVPLAHVKPHTPQLLAEAGSFLAQMDTALLDFSHPAMQRELHWDLQHASSIIDRYLPLITVPEKRALVETFLAHFQQHVEPYLPELRHSVIQNDGNDHNLLVSGDKKAPRQVVGLIDFGDMVYTCTVFEAAVAAAYAMLDKSDPIAAATQLIAGYHAVLPLTEQELEFLPALITMRLCTSVSISAYQRSREPDNHYLSISEQPAWALLQKLAAAHQSPLATLDLFHYTLRQACGLTPYPEENKLSNWLRENQARAPSLLPVDLRTADLQVLDLSVGSLNQEALTLPDLPPATRHSAAVGRYNEARLIYAGDAFQTDAGERRTIHIGLDLFMPAGTPLYAPLDGTVHSFQDNAAPYDYGPTLILQHRPTEDLSFYTLYGHLSRDSLTGLQVGMAVKQGQEIGRIGDIAVNGGWTPHLHFQIIGDLLGREGEFPGVAPASRRDVWLSLCPDPNLLLGIPAERFPPLPADKAALLAGRAEYLGPSLSISYQKPLQIVRGRQQYLYDENGRAYLDVVNNVCHVGHSHPHVVKALAQQAAVLNTNTRYLHANIVRFAERLLATFPVQPGSDPLEVCFFVCSGSEANELALRLARTYTGQDDMIVVDGAYHGNTAALIDISPYKHDGPGGSGAPAHVHTVRMPDPYRGPYKGTARNPAQQYAAMCSKRYSASRNRAGASPPSSAESLLGCGGPDRPAGWLFTGSVPPCARCRRRLHCR